jgi:hypothetical protein
MSAATSLAHWTGEIRSWKDRLLRVPSSHTCSSSTADGAGSDTVTKTLTRLQTKSPRRIIIEKGPIRW